MIPSQAAHDERTNSTIAERPPLVVELIGPAGAGKSTLLRALSQRDKSIQPDIRLSTMRKLPFLISNTSSLLPTFLRHYRHSRWFSWSEARSMVYLEAWLHVLRRQPSRNDVVTILDHGPLYRLARLRELGPDITTCQIFKRWWASLLTQWTATLDIVIWLDAPNAFLLERIRARDQKHSLEGKCKHVAYEYLTHYRTFLEQIISESLSARPITLLRFDTNQESVEQIVDKVLSTFDSAPNRRQVGNALAVRLV